MGVVSPASRAQEAPGVRGTAPIPVFPSIPTWCLWPGAALWPPPCAPRIPQVCPHTQRAPPEPPLQTDRHFPNPPEPHRDTRKPPTCCTEMPGNPHAPLGGTSLSLNSLSSHRSSSPSSPVHVGTALVTHTRGSNQSILLRDRRSQATGEATRVRAVTGQGFAALGPL